MKIQPRKYTVLKFASGDPVTPDTNKASLPAVAAEVARVRADKLNKGKGK